MKRLLTFFLAAAIACGLFGCAKQGQDARSSLSTNILINQACLLSQTLAMSTDPAYLKSLDCSEEVIGLAATFRPAIGKEPEEAKIITTDDTNFLSRVTEICGQANGAAEVGCCGTLTVTNQFYMETAPEKTTVVYLRYSEQCQMVAIFTSGRTHIVGATIYPLFSETAQRLLDEHFDDARTLKSKDIRKACEAAASVSVNARYTESEANELHYFKLANTAFVDMAPIDTERIHQATDDEAVIALAEQFAEVLNTQASDITLFHFPSQLNHKAMQALSQTQHGKALSDITLRRFCAIWINTLCKQYGAECVTANALLASLAGNRPLGAVANKDVTPALVILKLSSDVTMVMCVYPGEHNIYDYSFVCVPASYQDVCKLVYKIGAKEFK